MFRHLCKFLGMAGCVAVVAAMVLLRPQLQPPSEATAEQQTVPPAGGPRFVIRPYLQFPTRTSITVLWETDVPGSSLVEYAVATEVPPGKKPPGWQPALPLKAVAEQPATLHEVLLKDLEPGTKYVYRVTTTTADGKTIVGELLTFLTVTDADTAFSFTVIGDTQKNPTMTGRLARLMWARRPNFVVHVGDVVDEGPDKREWVNELFGPCAELFGRAAIFPTIGNHEKNDPHYYKYFALPQPEYYYRYRYGNADFFAIDTNSLRKLGTDSEQYGWLDRELGKSDARWKIVYHHHPAYTSDDDDYGDTYRGTSKQGDPRVRGLVPLYEKHNVDMVLNGHVHFYERTWPIRAGKVDPSKGIVYLTSGGGGGKLENFAPTPTWFKAEIRRDFHYCYVTIHGGRLVLKAYDQNDLMFDLLTLQK